MGGGGDRGALGHVQTRTGYLVFYRFGAERERERARKRERERQRQMRRIKKGACALLPLV